MKPLLIVNTPRTHRFFYQECESIYPIELARSGRAYNKYQYSLYPVLTGLILQPGYNYVNLTNDDVIHCGDDAGKARQIMLVSRVLMPKVKTRNKVKRSQPKHKQLELDTNNYLHSDPAYIKQQKKVKSLLEQLSKQRCNDSIPVKLTR